MMGRWGDREKGRRGECTVFSRAYIEHRDQIVSRRQLKIRVTIHK